MDNPILDDLMTNDKVIKEAEQLDEQQKSEIVKMHEKASLAAVEVLSTEELEKASNSLKKISESYTEIYRKIFQEVDTMGEAWQGADNEAYVAQIKGFCEELKQMADKVLTASTTLKTQKDNYDNRQQENITAVKKLTN